MKDLRHLIWFEELLQQAHNELVEQATARGTGWPWAILLLHPGGTAEPAGLLFLPPACPQQHHGGRGVLLHDQPQLPLCPLHPGACHRGGYNYLGALFGAEGCAAMERMEEHFFLLKPVENERFFVTIIDPPMKGDNTSLDYYKAQLREKVLDKLHQIYGIDTSEKALRGAIEKHNDLCRTVTAIGDFRRLDNPPITGYEFHVIQLVSQVCPHDLILPYLKETLEELKTRQPEPKFPFRARVVLAGSEIDDPEFTKLLEMCGAMVVADRYCFGSFPSREEIEIRDGETAYDAICRHYLHWNQCARFMDGGKIDQRHDQLERLVKDYHADGIIYESMKFCEFWSYEKVLASHILSAERGIPCCTIEKEYTLGSAGQLRTRFQAFVESLEIKKIEAARKGETK